MISKRSAPVRSGRCPPRSCAQTYSVASRGIRPFAISPNSMLGIVAEEHVVMGERPRRMGSAANPQTKAERLRGLHGLVSGTTATVARAEPPFAQRLGIAVEDDDIGRLIRVPSARCTPVAGRPRLASRCAVEPRPQSGTLRRGSRPDGARQRARVCIPPSTAQTPRRLRMPDQPEDRGAEIWRPADIGGVSPEKLPAAAGR
jgi:hypothetical protein